MPQPKIKLLIPVEIKEGCELPEITDNENQQSILVKAFFRGEWQDDCFLNDGRWWMAFHGKIKPTHWLKEVETGLTIDELKKLGVI